MAIQGIVTLDGDEIGTFDLNDKGHMAIVLHKISNSLEDVLDLATGNGMTVALVPRPDYNDYVPQHRQAEFRYP